MPKSGAEGASVQARRCHGPLPIRPTNWFALMALEVSVRGQREAARVRSISRYVAQRGTRSAGGCGAPAANRSRPVDSATATDGRSDSPCRRDVRNRGAGMAHRPEANLVAAVRETDPAQPRTGCLPADRENPDRRYHDADRAAGVAPYRGARCDRNSAPGTPADLGCVRTSAGEWDRRRGSVGDRSEGAGPGSQGEVPGGAIDRACPGCADDDGGRATASNLAAGFAPAGADGGSLRGASLAPRRANSRTWTGRRPSGASRRRR